MHIGYLGLYVIVYVWACMRYGKYREGIMIVPEGQSPEGTIIISVGTIIIPEGCFS